MPTPKTSLNSIPDRRENRYRLVREKTIEPQRRSERGVFEERENKEYPAQRFAVLQDDPAMMAIV
jgi:hypothetical protein